MFWSFAARSVTISPDFETNPSDESLMAKTMHQAVAYLRTSSAANVGSEKDSDKRQRNAIENFARHAGLEIVEEFYDADVSGADPIESRPGFGALLDRIDTNGVRIVIVEDASRFARQLIVQEAGIIALIERNVRVLTASGDDLTATDDPFKVAMRQIAGVFAQLEKARLVAKLKAARDRKRASGIKVEGRKSYAEIDARDHGGAMIALARKLRRRSPKCGRRSLRQISNDLSAAGYNSASGKPFAPTAVARMLGELK